MPVKRYAVEVRGTVIVSRRGNRLPVARPGGSPLQVERVGHNPRVRAVSLHHVQERLSVLPYRKRNLQSIGRDRRCVNNSCSLTTPQFCAGAACELPDALGGVCCRDV